MHDDFSAFNFSTYKLVRLSNPCKLLQASFEAAFGRLFTLQVKKQILYPMNAAIKAFNE
jgi:hypothetical protein